MSIDTNPVPIKSAAALLGHCANEIRLPLVPLTADKTELLKNTLEEFDLM